MPSGVASWNCRLLFYPVLLGAVSSAHPLVNLVCKGIENAGMRLWWLMNAASVGAIDEMKSLTSSRGGQKTPSPHLPCRSWYVLGISKLQSLRFPLLYLALIL